MNTYYALSSFNEKKKQWQDETVSYSLVNARKLAKTLSLQMKKKIRIVKESVINVYHEGKETIQWKSKTKSKK